MQPVVHTVINKIANSEATLAQNIDSTTKKTTDILVTRTELNIETTVSRKDDELLSKPVSLLDETIDIKINKIVTPQNSIVIEEEDKNPHLQSEAESKQVLQSTVATATEAAKVESLPSKKKSSKSSGVSCFSCKTKKSPESSDIIEVKQTEPVVTTAVSILTSTTTELGLVQLDSMETRSNIDTSKMFLNLDRRSSQKPSDTPSLYSNEINRAEKSEKSQTFSYELKEPVISKNRTESLIANYSMENLLNRSQHQQDSISETNSAEEKIKSDVQQTSTMASDDVVKLPKANETVTATTVTTTNVVLEEKADEEPEKESVSCFGKTKKTNKKEKRKIAKKTGIISPSYEEAVINNLKQNLVNEPVSVQGSTKKLTVINFTGLDHRSESSENLTKIGKKFVDVFKNLIYFYLKFSNDLFRKRSRNHSRY